MIIASASPRLALRHEHDLLTVPAGWTLNVQKTTEILAAGVTWSIEVSPVGLHRKQIAY